jgi:hypothetical protein
MSALHPLVFAVAAEDVEEDAAVSDAVSALAWLAPEEMHVPRDAVSPLVFRLAVQELRAINSRAVPADKLGCVVACTSLLIKALSQQARRLAAASDSAPAVGADDLLPCLIYVVLQANTPRLVSNIAYVERFRDATQLTGKVGYCFASLRSCVYHLQHLDAAQLELPEREFKAKQQAAREGRLRPWLETET